MASRAATAVEAKFSQLRLSHELISADTLPFGSLKGVSGLDQCFSYRMGVRHAFTSTESAATSKTHNIQSYRMKYLLVNKASPLWVRVYCAKINGGNKRVVRSYMVRRVRNAITDALKKYGYDGGGRKISNGAGEDTGNEDLLGTLIVSTKERSMTAKIDVVREQAEMAVVSMIQTFQQNPNKSPLDSSSQEPTQKGGARESGQVQTLISQKQSYKNKVFGGFHVNTGRGYQAE